LFGVFIHAFFEGRGDVKKCQLSASDRTGAVASSNKFFELEMVEVDGEVPKEVAFKGIVTVAENCFASELVFVVPEFFFDVD
jgi:hypothetical protein